MKIILISLISLVLPTMAISQTSTETFIATLNFGRSYNGTGDLRGFHYGISFYKYPKNNRFFWGAGFEGTLHDSESTDYTYTDDNGNDFEGKSRYVIAGMQLTGHIGYEIIKRTNHNFGIMVGPLLRYQVSSLPDVITTLYPVITEVPRPVQIIEFNEPFKTLAVGATLQAKYHYNFDSGILLGLLGNFQTDTNGDTISSVRLVFGKKF